MSSSQISPQPTWNNTNHPKFSTEDRCTLTPRCELSKIVLVSSTNSIFWFPLSHTPISCNSYSRIWAPYPEKTVQFKKLESGRPLLPSHSTIIEQHQVPLIQQEVHTKVVQDSIQKAEPNSSMDSLLIVNCEEISLPWPYRTPLSQFRSGQYIALNDYRKVTDLYDGISWTFFPSL